MPNKIKKIIFSALFLCLIFVFGAPVNSATEINAYFFWGQGCPHCDKEKEFLDYMKTKYRALKIYDFEVYTSRKNANILKQVGSKLNARIDGVPIVVIGDQVFTGYSEFLTSTQIENRIKECLMFKCPDSIFEIISEDDFLPDNSTPSSPSVITRLTQTTGGLIFLALFGIFIVGLIVYKAKK